MFTSSAPAPQRSGGDRGHRYRLVVPPFDRHVDVPVCRLGPVVLLAVDVDRAHRYRGERLVAERQRGLGLVQRLPVLRREPRLGERAQVGVVVAEDQDPLARAHARRSSTSRRSRHASGWATSPRQIDRVAGLHALAPLGEQVAVHGRDVGERPVEGLQRPAVAQVQVGTRSRCARSASRSSARAFRGFPPVRAPSPSSARFRRSPARLRRLPPFRGRCPSGDQRRTEALAGDGSSSRLVRVDDADVLQLRQLGAVVDPSVARLVGQGVVTHFGQAPVCGAYTSCARLRSLLRTTRCAVCAGWLQSPGGRARA